MSTVILSLQGKFVKIGEEVSPSYVNEPPYTSWLFLGNTGYSFKIIKGGTDQQFYLGTTEGKLVKYHPTLYVVYVNYNGTDGSLMTAEPATGGYYLKFVNGPYITSPTFDFKFIRTHKLNAIETATSSFDAAIFNFKTTGTDGIVLTGTTSATSLNIDVTDEKNKIISNLSTITTSLTNNLGPIFKTVGDAAAYLAGHGLDSYLRRSYWGVELVDWRWTGAFGLNMSDFCNAENIRDGGPGWTLAYQVEQGGRGYAMCTNKYNKSLIDSNMEILIKNVPILQDQVNTLINVASSSIDTATTAVGSLAAKLQLGIDQFNTQRKTLTDDIQKIETEANIKYGLLQSDYEQKSAALTNQYDQSKIDYQKQTDTLTAQLNNQIAEQKVSYDNKVATLQKNMNQIIATGNKLQQDLETAKLNYATQLKEAQDLSNENLNQLQIKYQSDTAIINQKLSLLNTKLNDAQTALETAQKKFNDSLASQEADYNKAIILLQQTRDMEIKQMNLDFDTLKSKYISDVSNYTLLLKQQQDKNDQLNDLISNLDIQIKNSKDSIANTKTMNEEQIKKLMADYDNQLNAIDTQIKNSNDLVTNTKTMNEEQIKKLTADYNNQLNTINTQIKNSDDLIANTKTTNEEQIKKLTTDYNNQLNTINKNKTQLITDYKQLEETKIKEFNDLIAKLQSGELELITSQNTIVLAELKSTQEKLAQTKINIQTDLDIYAKTKSDLQTQITDLQKILSNYTNDIVTDFSKLSINDKKKLAEILTDSNDQQTKIMGKYNDDLKIQQTNMTNDIKELTTSRDSILGTIKEYTIQRDALQSDFSKLTDTIMKSSVDYVTEILKKYKDVNAARSEAQQLVLSQFLDEQLKQKTLDLQNVKASYDDLLKSKKILDDTITSLKNTEAAATGSNSTTYIVIGLLAISIIGYYMYTKQ